MIEDPLADQDLPIGIGIAQQAAPDDQEEQIHAGTQQKPGRNLAKTKALSWEINPTSAFMQSPSCPGAAFCRRRRLIAGSKMARPVRSADPWITRPRLKSREFGACARRPARTEVASAAASNFTRSLSAKFTVLGNRPIPRVVRQSN